MAMRRRSKWTYDGSGAAAAYKSDRPRSVRGVEAKDIDVVYQPIVRLSNGRLFAHEALVRCKWPEFRVPPILFEHAVTEGYVGRLGRYIRDVTFANCTDRALFINVHPAELSARWLVRPDDPLCYHDRDVYLEITESAAFDYADLCMGVLKEICARTEAKLVVDDFGAGHSNLMRISDLEPDFVKLDRALIQELHKYKSKQAIVRNVVRMCDDLNIKLVAEGIETIDELSAVMDAGIPYGQGYLLARPAYPPPKVTWPDGMPRQSRPPTGRTRRPKPR